MSAARDLDHALANWTRAGSSLQYWQHMQAQAVVLMYQGRFDEALAFSDARMSEIGRTFLFRIQAIPAFATDEP